MRLFHLKKLTTLKSKKNPELKNQKREIQDGGQQEADEGA